MQGIYKIENINDGRVYVGRSIHIEERWKEHLRHLENGTHHSSKLQKCYNELDNKNDLVFTVLEKIEDRWKLPAAEQYYINKFDAYEKGFNGSPFADNPKYTSVAGTKIQHPFVWFRYEALKPVFSQLKSSTITRIMYMATYLSTNGYLVYGNNKSIKDGLLSEIMKLPYKTYYSFWNEIVENNIAYKKDNRIYLNGDYFLKGKMYKLKGTSCMRVMVDGNRKLYENSTEIRDHKKISYIYKLIPYINKEWNELCYNPEEPEQDYIKNMKISTLGDIIGYAPSKIRRCIDQLCEFDIDGKPIIEYTSDKKLIVNPDIYYAGNNIDSVKFC